MGGCRCSYRSCSARSDGKTHLFHFPVYDKVRCHQWIINSRRYEFLNLTVSQVRNRVVCQHHFKEECFMNYKKEKLIFDAIPTEDGPYCDSSKEEEINELDKEKANLVLDEIETEPMYLDKRAKSSLKYRDFLANYDTEGKNSLESGFYLIPPIVPPKEENVTKSQIKTFQDLIKVNKSSKKDKKSYTDKNLSKEKECSKQYDTDTLQKTDIVEENNQPIVNNNNELQFLNNSLVTFYNVPNTTMDNVVSTNLGQPIILFPPNNNTRTTFNGTGLIDNQQNQLMIIDSYSTNRLQNAHVPGDSKVKILSEKRILPVSQSLILQVPHMEKICDDQQISSLNNMLACNTIDEINPMDVGVQQFNTSQIVSCEDLTSNKIVLVEPPKIEIEVEKYEPQKITEIEMEKYEPQKITEIEMEKYEPQKITEIEMEKYEPQKIAEIEKYVEPEKDAELEKCVDKSVVFTHSILKSKSNSKSNEAAPKISLLKSKLPPERQAAIEKKRSFNKKLRDIVESCLEKSDEQETIQNTSNILKVRDTENVGVFLSKHNDLPNTQEYTLAFLESRMKKMENVLLKKIEQNSNRILDLKNCVAPRKRTSAYTQTSYSEDAHKKHLYQEISKFLSPSATSVVFEELFLKKYAQKESDCKPTPKRKRRR